MSDEVIPAGQPLLDVVTVREGMFGASGSGDTSGFGGLVTVVPVPAASPRPFGGYFDVVADELSASLGDFGTSAEAAIEKVVIAHGEMTIHVRAAELVNVARTLRDEPGLRFELCLGVSGAHYPHHTGRELHAVYHLRSITHGRVVRIEVSVPDSDPHVPSLVSVYPTNHLTRIQMPDDWQGHPQRKDYPLGGIPVEYKGATVPPADERRSYN